MSRNGQAAWFITGTDTGVGKTRCASALIHALRGRGLSAIGMKPIAAGVQSDARGVLHNEDVLELRAASSLVVPPELDNPYLLPEPLSPHLAARHAGVQIDIARMTSAFDQLTWLADAVVVEGAGGFLVPISGTHTSADFAQALGLPIIMVVGLRLGCLNHALLTQEAILSRGLHLAGWVANRLDPQMLCVDENIETLRQRLTAPLLADWPHARDALASSLALDLAVLF